MTQEALFAGDGSRGETPTQAAERLEKENERLKKNTLFLLRQLGEPGRCRSCSAQVFWIKVRTGKLMPMDQDGASHFSTCPEASEWRRAREQ